MKTWMMLALTLFCMNAGAQSHASNVGVLGCLDCFNFVAPTIYGAENVNPAEVGLIVYDSYYNSFRGFNLDNRWVKMSNDMAARTVSTSTNILATDDVVLVNAASGALTETLPEAATVPGKIITVKKSDSSANIVTVDGYSTETIDGAANKKLLVQYDLVKLVSSGGNWLDVTQKPRRPPTVTNYLSGSGTYTTPAGAVYLRVRLVGGGGGGGGGGTTGTVTNGGSGGSTTFGSSLLTGTGGSGACTGSGGGAATMSSPAIGTALSGGAGAGFTANNSVAVFLEGGHGATSPFGGAGRGAPNSTGSAAVANTGSGGGGGGSDAAATNRYACSGGGAGGFIDAILPNPGSSYAYSVGAGGTAGAAGTSGFAGGAGGSGAIEITEYYQ